MSKTRTIKRKNISKLLFLLLGLVFSWYTLNRMFFFRSGVVERFTAACVYPFIVASGNIAGFVHGLAERRQSYQELVEKNRSLQKSYDALQHAFITFATTSHFNQDTEEILEFKKRYALNNALLAKVLMRTISPEEHSIIINRGARDGVKKDMVGIYKLQIVGRVIEVTDYYSKIQLVTDAQSKVAAHTNTTGAAGIVTGCNSTERYAFNYVSYINQVQADDLVFSSGQGMIFPEGFCLGKISKLVTNDKALYHDIEIQPLVDLAEITYCLLTDNTKITLF